MRALIQGAMDTAKAQGASVANARLLVVVPVGLLLRGTWGAEGVYVAELAANLVGGLVAVASLWWVFWRKA